MKQDNFNKLLKRLAEIDEYVTKGMDQDRAEELRAAAYTVYGANDSKDDGKSDGKQ